VLEKIEDKYLNFLFTLVESPCIIGRCFISILLFLVSLFCAFDFIERTDIQIKISLNLGKEVNRR